MGKRDHQINRLFPGFAGKFRYLFTVAGVLVILSGIGAARLYFVITKPVIGLGDRKFVFLYIHTGTDFRSVRDTLVNKGYLADPGVFEWLAKYKRYDENVKPGKYRLVNGMRNNALVNLLRSGRQEPVRITIQNVRTPGELAGRIGKRLEADSATLHRMFSDPAFLARYGASPRTLFVLFIPDTYEFFWNTSGEQLFNRMQKEYSRFWDSHRLQQADSLELSVPQVVTLASIVEKETNKKDEKPVIAGVYLNRLKRHIPLQADPTVIFAWNDYRIKRVLKVHTEIKSPYNTYNHTGLPPGPICLPSVASIDAVLNAQRHSYLYFCAREDLSGYHNFAANLDDHNRNARKYRKALDKLKIR